MHTKLYFSILIGLVLIACESQPTLIVDQPLPKKDIEQKFFHPSSFEELYKNIRPSVERFSIDAQQTQIIKNKDEVEILIPPNSFIDDQNKPIRSNVEIELLYLNNLTDLIAYNLQTCTERNLLSSSGMLYINAKSNGKNVHLAKGQKLSITLPLKNRMGTQTFIGQYDEQNNIKWKVNKSSEKNYLIPFPEDILYEPYWDSDSVPVWYNSLDSEKYNPRNNNYKNTFIQTREFKGRIWKLYEETLLISSLMNKNLTWDDRAKIKLNDQLFDLYFSNLDVNIEVLDSMANSIVQNYIQQPEYIAWMNSPVDTADHLNAFFKETYNQIDYLLDFDADGAKGNIPNFQSYGINLLSNNAYDNLIAKGVPSNKALTMINFEKERAHYIRFNKKLQLLSTGELKNTAAYTKTVFSTSELGWLNCGNLVDTTTGTPKNIKIIIESETEFDAIECFTLIPEPNIKLNASLVDKQTFICTKKGQEANYMTRVVAVAKKEDTYYFGSEIIYDEDYSISLEIHPIKAEALKNELEDF